MAAVEGVVSALERNWEMVDATLASLDDATLARRPTDQCNSIAWLLWHMTRVVDTFVHTRLQAQPQVWIQAGWYARFGMDPDPDNRGVGWATHKWRSGFPLQKMSKWATMRRSNRLPGPT